MILVWLLCRALLEKQILGYQYTYIHGPWVTAGLE